MIFCMFLFFHVLFMFQKEELQEIIVNAISTARGRGGWRRGRGGRGRGGRGRARRRGGGRGGITNIYHIIIISNSTLIYKFDMLYYYNKLLMFYTLINIYKINIK